MAFSAEAAKQQTAAILSKDSGGGFFIEDEDGATSGGSASDPSVNLIASAPSATPSSTGSREGLMAKCEECNERLEKSFLKINFQLDVCDACRDDRGKHSLITRTDAKNEFLLKDCDMDRREPMLPFLVKKNPHERAKGDMRLYLRSQVQERGIAVWGSEEAIDQERENRNNKRKDRKHREFNKKITALRMNVRSSLYTRASGENRDHVHDFGDEVCVDQDNDMYERSCQTCDFVNRYEKL